ncbi:unnamed protein product [Paramecium primaurelia]|uniref:Uncharacterized protein n=1 Tax=Paramecium primaurelia TaxID=5886 RepID=A0A8S1PTT1_PARPR|nr:unnamed protein product [Paramecium primaurelia]
MFVVIMKFRKSFIIIIYGLQNIIIKKVRWSDLIKYDTFYFDIILVFKALQKKHIGTVRIVGFYYSFLRLLQIFINP